MNRRNFIQAVLSMPLFGLMGCTKKSSVLTKVTALDQINLKHLVIEIERILQPFILQSNNASTRFNVQLLLQEFLERCQTGKCIQEYRVVCDETNNLPSTIDNGKLRVNTFVKMPNRIGQYNFRHVLTSTGTASQIERDVLIHSYSLSQTGISTIEVKNES